MVALLLDAGEVEEAETLYRKDLELHAENGWALNGIGDRAIELYPKLFEVSDVDDNFARYSALYALQKDGGERIRDLRAREEELDKKEKEELRTLVRERQRIARVERVKRKRRREDPERKIAALQARIRKLETLLDMPSKSAGSPKKKTRKQKPK